MAFSLLCLHVDTFAPTPEFLDVDRVCNVDLACVHEITVGMAHAVAAYFAANNRMTLFAPYGPESTDHLGLLLVWDPAVLALGNAAVGKPAGPARQSTANTYQQATFALQQHPSRTFVLGHYRLPAMSAARDMQGAVVDALAHEHHPDVLCLTGVHETADVHAALVKHGMLCATDCLATFEDDGPTECIVGMKGAVAKDCTQTTKSFGCVLMLTDVPIKRLVFESVPADADPTPADADPTPADADADTTPPPPVHPRASWPFSR